MEKILLAVGFKQLEEYLEKQLKKEFLFVGVTTYREGVIKAIGQKNPNIVIIRETLEGNEDIVSIVYEIRKRFPNLRIIFIAGKREPGDAVLATLVNYGIYDIIVGDKIQAQNVVALVRKANEYKDVYHLQPAPSLDEKTNKVLFQAPEATEKVKEVIKEVYISPTPSPEKPTSHTLPATSTTTQEIDNQQKQSPEQPVKDKQPTGVDVDKKPEDVKLDTTLKDGKKPSDIVETVNTPSHKPFWGGQKNTANAQNALMVTKQKIITFMGSKNGVGNSSMALNTAILLAQRGLKTIYIEMNEKKPSVSYWYELGLLTEGIDSSLIALTENNYKKVDSAIIQSRDLKKKETLMQKNYKKLPEKLDFMFFSSKYLTRDENEDLQEPIDFDFSKELYLYLIFQKEYDVVILDVPSDISFEPTKNALVYSSQVFITATQDVSTIGYSLYDIHELEKKGIPLNRKLHYIINKYEDAELSLKGIGEWIETENLLSIPNFNKEFINANFIGLPLILYSKNQNVKNAFLSIEKVITTK